jgi:hypothetical protein
VRFEPFKMVTTSYLGRQVDPMLEVHTEQKVEFPLTEDFFYYRVNSCKASVLILRTDIWLEREDLGTSLLLCPGKMFRQGTKISFPCYGIFSAS